ncbi:S8 family peptidase [bacterium]|nr:S8 family peptidase [bacterium]
MSAKRFCFCLSQFTSSLTAALVLSAILIPTAGSAAAGYDYVPGRLLVNFDPAIGEIQNRRTTDHALSLDDPALDLLLEQYAVHSIARVSPDEILSKYKTTPDLFHLTVLSFPEDYSMEQAAADFRQHPFVRSANPDYLMPFCDIEPNDPLWESQWDKRFMNCPLAWEFSTGSRDVSIAVIDMGMNWQFEDFHQNLWANPGEDIDGDGTADYTADYPGDPDDINGVDDDDNGYVDDFLGWDFINLTGNCEPEEDCDGVQDNNPLSISAHGTQMYGVAGSVGNNELGITGGCWSTSLIGVRAGAVTTTGSGIVTSSAISAIIYAGAMGVDVISMSFSIPLSSGPWEDVINAAWNQGSILCAATANDGDTTAHYPAALDNVVAVGSIESDTTLSLFTNFGPSLDLYAPGRDIMAPDNNALGYAPLSGTSVATANAAGAFALLKSIWSESSNQEIVDRVEAHSRSIVEQNPTYDPSYLGWGTIDLESTLSAYLPYLDIAHFVVEDIQGGDGDERLEAGEWSYIIFGIVNDGRWHVANDVTVTVTTDDPALTLTNTTYSWDHIMPGQMVSNLMDALRVDVDPIIADVHTSEIVFEINASGVTLTRSVSVRVGRPSTLLIIDDHASGYGNYYIDALDELLTASRYDSVSVLSLSALDMPGFNEYENVIWICGNEAENTITPADQTLLASYLDEGGNLLLAGQNIDEDLAGTDFYSNYLHAISEGLAGNTQLSGVTGDPVADGTSLLLIGGGCAGNGALSPSRIQPMGSAVGLYEYSQGGFGAIRYEGGYRVIYFSCALEAACGMVNTTHYVNVLERILEYFGEPIQPVHQWTAAGIPTSVMLHQNYPNPFNPETTIAFDLKSTGHVSLNIYNTIGQIVATLVNRTMSPGRHTVSFNGSSLPSGIYLYRIQADGTTAERKMMLVK